MTTPATIEDVERRLRERRYIGDRALATSIFLALKLQKPLFIEGEAGDVRIMARTVAPRRGSADYLGRNCCTGAGMRPVMRPDQPRRTS